MGTQQIGLRDVSHGRAASRSRVLAPLRYLLIRGPEKAAYDFRWPAVIGTVAWLVYWVVQPQIALFGDAGLLGYARDLLVMAVPFLFGALAVVAMTPSTPGLGIDARPRGAELILDGRSLSLKQFVCYLLGYLSFLGLATLGVIVASTLFHDTVTHALSPHPVAFGIVRVVGTYALSLLLSALSVTVFWALYFLTDVVNHTD